MFIQSTIFALVLALTAYLSYRSYARIWRVIRLGKAEAISDRRAERLRNVFLIAFGQKKMFKRWVPAVLHGFVYLAFLFTQIELLEIIIDGLTGRHRFFAHILGPLYRLVIGTIELLSILALMATIVFIFRRVVLKLPRFHSAEMRGWPFRDALYILLAEIVLVLAILMMNGADVVLQGILPDHYPNTGFLPVSSVLGPTIFGDWSVASLRFVERFAWWLHFLVICGFILYLPISKHLHIFLAFPNVYFSRLGSRGAMKNMPEIMNEVKSMMGLVEDSTEVVDDDQLPEFGAKDVFDLSWRDILSAYTCTECGRCSSVCPAQLTGKKLSPRKVMMDVRDRADEVYRALDSGGQSKESFDDGKSLFDRITREELHACTTCQACVEACPVLINPMEIILAMRRYEILTESAGPEDWVPMFTSLENSGSVWQVTESRTAWMDDSKSN